MLHVPTSRDVQPASPKLPGLRRFKNWALSALCLSFLTLVLTFSASGQILYGISNGNSFGEEFNLIFRIDPATGQISNAHQITLAGVTIERSNALAVRPGDGTLFAVIQAIGAGSGDPTGRRLVTINPNTGVATDIGPINRAIAGLSFRPDGTLWAVIGDGDPNNPESLYTVNTSTAALTFRYALGNGGDGEAIAFHYSNGLLYHASGPFPDFEVPGDYPIFESVDVSTGIVTQLNPDPGPAGFEATGMSYSRILGQMYLSATDRTDPNGWVNYLYTVDLATGARTLVGEINTPVDGLDSVPARGLAFYEITTAAPASISGRLLSRTGAPVHKGMVTATGQNGTVYTAKTDKKGRFKLNGLPTGESYVITAEAKRYRFPSTFVTLSEDVSDITLTATR